MLSILCVLSEDFCSYFIVGAPTNDGGVNHKSVVSDDYLIRLISY